MLPAQETGRQNFDWNPVLDSNQAVTIHGVSYMPECALHDWNIRCAPKQKADRTRFEVRQGDQWDEDRNSGENKERSELDGYKTTWTSSADVWCAYSFLIEPGPRCRSDWCAIGQMHATRGDVKPLHFHFNDEKLVIYSEASDARTPPIATKHYQEPLARSIWHHMVFHMRQHPTTGRLEVWLDDARIVDFSGPMGGATAYYWKFGIYRGYGPIATPLAVEFANMEIGTADLTPRIAKPLAP